MRKWFFQYPLLIRLFLNWWPPFLFTGIKITRLSADFQFCQVKLKNWPGTRNINNSQFGGSLFAMTDPIYSLMLMGILGFDRYYIWDKAASIDFIKPGKGSVFINFKITDEDIQLIKDYCQHGEKYFPTFSNEVIDSKQATVARLERTLYVRLKPEHRQTN